MMHIRVRSRIASRLRDPARNPKADMTNLRTIFPKASQSFMDVNQQLAVEKTEIRLNTGGKIQGIKSGKLMNKTESEYALILEARARRDEIKQSKFEEVKIRIGDGCWYVPDFFVERHDQKPLFIEIKGFMRDDARVKFLAAKELHTWADFEMWRKTKSGWEQIL
jgi:hypothetical protein